MVVSNKNIQKDYKYVMKGSSSVTPGYISLLTFYQHIMLWGISNSNDGRGFRIVKLIKK